MTTEGAATDGLLDLAAPMHVALTNSQRAFGNIRWGGGWRLQ